MNKFIGMGRLTADPDVRYTQTTNTCTARFSLAINRRFVKEGEERQADFINIVAFGKTAEFISKYFKKGQQVAVVGRIQTRTWDDDQGQKHYVTEIVAEEVYFADSKKEFTSDAAEPTNNSTSNTNPFEVSDQDTLPF